MFVHLSCHTNYSFQNGASTISDYIQKAVQYKMPAAAITDRNGLYGAVKFQKEALVNNIRPIIGTDLGDSGQNVILLAKNKAGYSEISALISKYHLTDDFDMIKELNHISGNIFCLVPWPKMLQQLRPLPNIFGETRPEYSLDIVKQNYRIREASNSKGLKTVLTNNVFFASKEDFFKYKILNSIRHNCTLCDIEAKLEVSEENYFKSHDELKRWNPPKEEIENSLKISKECRFELTTGKYFFPKLAGDSAEALRQEVRARVKKRYPQLSPQVVERVKYELRVINKLQFNDYFLIILRVIEYAKKEGIYHIGRGSAANSIVAYILGITEVDPIRYNLFFERFLNEARKSPPDIDLDFSWKNRDKILEFMFEEFGYDKVAMLCTINRFGVKSAFREIAKVFGTSERELNKIAKYIPYHIRIPVSQWFEEEMKNSSYYTDHYREIFRLSEEIVNYPNHLSIHAGGLVISPGPITDFVPLTRAEKNITITQYDMYSMEDVGLVKFDILSQRGLGVFESIIDQVQPEGIHELESIFCDTDTNLMMRQGKTMGCFYIESPGMRNLLRKLKVTDYSLLTAASSIIRPGVAESGMMDQFIRSHNDPKSVKYIHPMLRKILPDTYGIMIYQEDVIKVAHYFAGLNLSDADILRRGMSGKYRSKSELMKIRDKYFLNCYKKGYRHDIAQKIWDQMKSFAGYAFCKAHSASFAILSYQLAYLRSRYPAEFIAAVLSNEGGFYTAEVYINEGRRMGLQISLPYVNKADYNYKGEDGRVTVGLKAIKNVHRKVVKELVRERDANGPFKSFTDFLQRVKTGRKDCEILIKLGCFDQLNPNRLELLWHCNYLFRKIEVLQSGAFLGDTVALPRFEKKIKSYTLEEKCITENHYLEYMVSAHPLDLFEDRIDRKRYISTADFPKHKNRLIRTVGWLIHRKRITTRKSREYMQFLTFEDQYSDFDTVLFPNVFKKFWKLAVSKGPFYITGQLKEEYGAFIIELQHLELFEG